MANMTGIRTMRSVAAAWLIFLPGKAWTDVDTANEAYRSGDHATAFHEYLEAARAGDSRAFGRLAGLYLYGAGTEKDHAEAYIWFSLAEDSGDKYAGKFRDAAAAAMTRTEIEGAETALEQRREQLGGKGD